MLTLPASAPRQHLRRILRLQGIAVAAIRRVWLRMDPGGSWERQYESGVGPQVLALVVAAQVAAARESDSYIAEVLNELGFGPATSPGVLIPQSFAGVTANGSDLNALLGSSVGRARAVLSDLRDNPESVVSRTITPPSEQAAASLEAGLAFLEAVVESTIADTMRSAELAAMVQRPWVAGYVRVAEPGACSRCIILAGKFYLFNDGFPRHPRCRCDHIPAPENRDEVAGLMAINSPDRYFDSLTEDEQNRVFTAAGAEAIRNGADIGQVVNARKGMSTVNGRLVRNSQGLFTTTAGRSARGRRRLMPESIVELADGDRDELIRLLRLYRYII